MATSNSPPENLRGEHENHVAWLLRRVWDRMNTRNEHFMGCIVGREGSGKSHTAIRIAHEIDPTFNANRVIFDVKNLLEVLESGEHEPGNVYVLDEAGVQMGARTWHDRAQILANQALQLVRDHNLGVIFTLPIASELDKQAHGRIQAMLEVVNKEEGEHVDIKWKWIDPDRVNRNGKLYKKFPRRRQNGRLKRITSLRIGPPDTEIIDRYEMKKNEFQASFYRETIEEMEGAEEEQDKDLSPNEIATQLIDSGMKAVISEHGRTGEPYIDHDLIRAEYDISHADARTAKKLIRKQIDEDELESEL